MITFSVADVIRLGLAMAVACALGLLIGLAMRRKFRPEAPIDLVAAGWMWLGFWAFAMLLSLITDLTAAAGQPFWLKALLMILLCVMGIGMSMAERRHSFMLRRGPSEPIRQEKDGSQP